MDKKWTEQWLNQNPKERQESEFRTILEYSYFSLTDILLRDPTSSKADATWFMRNAVLEKIVELNESK